MKTRHATLPLALLAAVLCVVVWSWIGASDRMTWWLESFPDFIALPSLLFTWKRFPLTPLAYVLIAVHMCILLVGGHYTYAEVPLGNWARDHFHLQRNDYDKLGHLAQGFVPAIVAREILIRKRTVNGRGWLFFIVFCICMAISACYELLEWGVAVIQGSGADAFLGTQGDPWDTQSDMFCALIGSVVAQVALNWWHDRQIAALE
jgi:putative membrane protein